MIYFTQMQGCRIDDANGQFAGYLRDLVFVDGKKKAGISHIILSDENNNRKKISWAYVSNIGLNVDREVITRLQLNDPLLKIHPLFVAGGELLVGDIMDKQVVDIDNVKIVRVNDVLLGKIEDKFYIMGVAIGRSSFLRRLGLHGIAKRVKELVIPWEQIEWLGKQVSHNLHVKVEKKKIADMHAEDIADLMGDLSRNERMIIFNSLNRKKAAKTLIGAEDEVKQSLFRTLKAEKIKALLEDIPSNQAADILGMMSKTRAEEILRMMRRDTAARIKKILNYTPDSAGSIMKTDTITIPLGCTVEQATDLIRKLNHTTAKTYYLYVVDADSRLVGFLGVAALLMHDAHDKVDNIMDKTIISVKTSTPKEDIAKIMGRYDLLVLPVVDSNDRLVGIVSADDIITEVIPESWVRERVRPHRIKREDENK